MGTYIDDERQSIQPPGPRQQGWPQMPHLRRRSGSMGLRTRFSPLAPCSWGICDQSILIFGCDRARGYGNGWLAPPSLLPGMLRGDAAM